MMSSCKLCALLVIAILLGSVGCTIDSPLIDEKVPRTQNGKPAEQQAPQGGKQPDDQASNNNGSGNRNNNNNNNNNNEGEGRRCSTPEDCKSGMLRCCIPSSALDSSKRVPGTIPDDKKGICGNYCEQKPVSPTIKNPIALCKNVPHGQKGACPSDQVCGMLNLSTQIGYCFEKDKVSCIDDTDCPLTQYCVNNALAKSLTIGANNFDGICSAKPTARAICNTVHSRIPLPTPVSLSLSAATPYCVPSKVDSSTNPASITYGRIVYFCTSSAQCDSVTTTEPSSNKDSIICKWTNIKTDEKPKGIGICQYHDNRCSNYDGHYHYSSATCAQTGFSCCDTYSQGDSFKDAHCTDTALTGGDCQPFEQVSLNPESRAKGVRLGFCQQNDDDYCKNIYGKGYSCKDYITSIKHCTPP